MVKEPRLVTVCLRRHNGQVVGGVARLVTVTVDLGLLYWAVRGV
jgi:hypothetical protein